MNIMFLRGYIMLHLLLIGGGEIGAPKGDGSFRPLETLDIDKHFVKSIGKTNPRILFIPTATEMLDEKRLYEKGIYALYGERLGCSVDTLYFLENPTQDEIKNKLQNADAIYIGGGNTAHMFEIWQRNGFQNILKKVALSGKPIAGLSAGSMCWFEKVVIKNNDESMFIEGIGLLKGYCLPHFNKKKDLFAKEKIAQNTSFIGIDECAALEVNGAKINVIKSKTDAGVYNCGCIDNTLWFEKIQQPNNKLLLQPSKRDR